MKNNDSELKQIVNTIMSIREIILTNVVLIGQTPCQTRADDSRKKTRRTQMFLDRLAEAQPDELTTDFHGNPLALFKGSSGREHPIMLVAHMDTALGMESECHYQVSEDYLIGPGLIDNSLGVGVLMSIPDVLKTLGIRLKSDLVLIGLPESLRDSNLKSIRNFLSAWKSPVKAAVCVEGGEIGRLNYFSKGMIRAEILCDIPQEIGYTDKYGLNAIIVMNEVINRILAIRLPLRPQTNIVLGEIHSGYKHGELPLFARLGFEIHSDSDSMVEDTFGRILEISDDLSHKFSAQIRLRKISSVKAAHLHFHHPMIKAAIQVMEALEIKPIIESSESELSVFLSHRIPAITLAVAHGLNPQKENEKVFIPSIYKGITQLVGVIMAIDQEGVK